MWTRGFSSRGVLITQRCHFSARPQSESAGIDDFLHSIGSLTPSNTSKSGKVLEKATEFRHWLEKNPAKSFEQFKEVAQMAINVRSAEQNEAFSLVSNVAVKVLPDMYSSLKPTEIVEILRYLLQMAPKSQVSNDVQKIFKSKNIQSSELSAVRFNTLIMVFRYADSSVDQQILTTIADALCARIDQELNTVQLLALFAGNGYDNGKWFRNKKFVEKVEKLVNVMDTDEKCALLKVMATTRQRNIQLIGALSNSICFSSQILDVNHIVNITSSCAILNYYPPKIAKKISQDLEKNTNVLKKWSNVMAIADSFIRLRMGDEKSWNILVNWAIENEKHSTPSELSRFVSGLARIGIPSGKPLASALKKHLQPTRVSTQSAWLNIIYSLAYFQEMEALHADSVLNKSFIEKIMNSTLEVHDRLRHAMTLLMINSSAKIDLKNQYCGPTVSRETFTSFGINFDAKTIRNARQLKYSSDQSECDDVFLKSLFKIAPQDTHCGMPNVESSGVFVDAYVMPDQNTGLLVNRSQWGTVKPRPLLFYGWRQTKKNMEANGESLILGKDQLGLRLLRAEGFEPVVVLKTELDYCATDVDRVKMLRDKIHKKSI